MAEAMTDGRAAAVMKSEMREGTGNRYSLGWDDGEIARLDAQSAWLEAPTRLLLRAAGIGPGLRVLDLGTGIGHLATIAAELVGPQGRVVGIDRSSRFLEVAAKRASSLPQVQFVESDVRSWQSAEPFDAVIGRLILFHLPDPSEVLRHHAAALRPGGLVVALDYDVGSLRAEPPLPLLVESADRILAAFRSAGANPTIGARLALILAEAGLTGVQTFGIQGYLGPDDPRGPAMLTGVMRSLAPQMVAAGIATLADLDLDTLGERCSAQMRASGSVLLPPVLAGAWARRP